MSKVVRIAWEELKSLYKLILFAFEIVYCKSDWQSYYLTFGASLIIDLYIKFELHFCLHPNQQNPSLA